MSFKRGSGRSTRRFHLAIGLRDAASAADPFGAVDVRLELGRLLEGLERAIELLGAD